MIQLSQIRCFVMVAQELNFGRAAERLNMTQPPLSRQIQQLEKTLGLRLLDRDRRGVLLTEAGSAFLPEAIHLLKSGEAAVDAAQRAFRGDAGRVAVGHSVSYAFVPDLVTAASVRLPNVRIELEELLVDEQLDRLRGGSLDLALIPMAPDLPDLSSMPVLREPFLAALPSAHRLAKDTRRCDVRLQDFEGEPFIMYPPGAEGHHHQLLSAMFAAHGVAPRHVQFIRHLHSILALVNLGAGLALVPASAARMAYPEVVFRPLAPEPSEGCPMAELHLVWRSADEKDNPVVNEMRRFILSQAKT